MSSEPLRNLDLNLLLALDALLIEHSVSRAAQRTGVTQPAMSQALARLRNVFDDPLLVRAGRGMAPTSLGDSLAAPLHGLLSQLGALVHERGVFVSQTSTRTFRIACLDHFSALHLPGLLSALREEAPGVNLVATQLSYDTLGSDLDRDAVDVGVGVFGDTPAGLMQQVLHTERLVCLVRRGHPALRKWNMESYLSHPHGLLSTTGRGPSVVDRALAARDLSRRVAVRVPHFLAAGAIAAQSDVIFTLPERLATSFTAHLDVVCVKAPLPSPPYQMVLRWHRRAHKDPAHSWFREQVTRSSK